MNRAIAFAIILIALCIVLERAQAQNAYRCGSSYSQTPCPGGVPVDTADTRSKDQKAAAEAVAKRDMRMADSMEKSRLQQEEAQRKLAAKTAGTSAGKPAAKEAPSDKQAHSSKKKSRPPEYFTARTGEKKKKSAPTSPADNTATSAAAPN